MTDAEYPPTKRSRTRLFGGRGSNGKSAVHGVIDSALYGVVSYAIDNQPFATPTMVWRQDDYLYWHGSAGSRMLKHLAAGADVCINFTQLDGFVLSRLASAHTLNYRSVMVFGRTEPVVSLEERLLQLQTFMDSRFPGRWDEIKRPSLHELKSILMVRMRIEEGSLKRREGPPADGLPVFGGASLYAQACWAGEIPLGVVAYAPRPAPRLQAEVSLPAYVADFASRIGCRTPAEELGPPPLMRFVVLEMEVVACEVLRIRLQAVVPARLPAIGAGAHARIGVVLRDGTRDFRPYSIVEADAGREWFDIAVLKEPDGQGGSVFLHEQVQLGDQLQVEAFANAFVISADTRSAVLIAGGIGVTPIVAMARDLKAWGIPFEVHYAVRGERTAAFRAELALLAGNGFHFYDSALEGRARMPLPDVVGEPTLGRHLYVCGPAALADEIVSVAATRGFPADQVHCERFKAPAPQSTDGPVEIRLERSKRQLEVLPGTSILDAVLAAGIDVPHSCKRGECGECAVRVLGGEISHRDRVLSEAQRDDGLACLCVAWGKGEWVSLAL